MLIHNEFNTWVSLRCTHATLAVYKDRQLKTMDNEAQVNTEIAVWEQTAAEFIQAKLIAPIVTGYKVAINEEWSFIVNEVDERGGLRSVELKHYEVEED